MEKIQFYGSVYSHSGPAVHAQELCRSLDKQGFDVSIACHFPQNTSYPIDSEIYVMTQKPDYDKAITIILDPPNTWWMHMNEPRKALIGIVVLEGSNIPYDWAFACAQPEITQLWCPSNHVKAAILKSAKDFELDIPENKIKVLPHGYNPEYFHVEGKVKDFNNEDEFTFLYVGGWSQGFNDRKGLDIFYQAFCEEFKKDEKIRGIAKITSVYNAEGYDPAKILKSIKVPEDHADFSIALGDVKTKEELAEIYRAGDIIVQPSKAEGFSMTTLEAMACGLVPLIQAYGGMIDFVTPDNGFIIKQGKEIDATDENVALYDWSKWRLIDKDKLKKTMRKIFSNQELIKSKQKTCLNDVKKWTWNNTGEQAKKLINNLIQ